jgi:hypothetical protein
MDLSARQVQDIRPICRFLDTTRFDPFEPGRMA